MTVYNIAPNTPALVIIDNGTGDLVVRNFTTLYENTCGVEDLVIDPIALHNNPDQYKSSHPLLVSLARDGYMIMGDDVNAKGFMLAVHLSNVTAWG